MSGIDEILAGYEALRPGQEAFYQDLHQHPELSHQEHDTARRVAEKLQDYGFAVHTGIGGTGVTGVLANGSGPVVLLRCELDGLPPEILFVALPGHTEGHAGVAVDLGEGWLLHAADTYYHRHEMDRRERECPPATRGYQRMMAADYGLHLANQARLRELYRDRRQPITVFCTHDPVELEALCDLNVASGLPARGNAAPEARDGRAASP